MSKNNEVFISVDVETAGPIPGEFSLLSVGACCIDDPEQTFLCDLKPTSERADPEALRVTGMSLEQLKQDGVEPMEAMARFQDWIASVSGPDRTPVFVGFNAAFDWSFINYYFHRYLGTNPFGFAALDIKSLYMGASGSSWAGTRSSQMAAVLRPKTLGDHNALHDAQHQAELFRLVRAIRT
jgi:ribonuclease T